MTAHNISQLPVKTFSFFKNTDKRTKIITLQQTKKNKQKVHEKFTRTLFESKTRIGIPNCLEREGKVLNVLKITIYRDYSTDKLFTDKTNFLHKLSLRKLNKVIVGKGEVKKL